MNNVLTETIKERLSSPVFGPFLLSWCVWNWRILLFAFTSGLLAEEKIKRIEALLFWETGFFFPALFAAIYIFGMPYILVQFGRFANWINRLSQIRDHNHELRVRIDREFNYTLPYSLIENLINSILTLQDTAQATHTEISSLKNANISGLFRSQLLALQNKQQAHLDKIASVKLDYEHIQKNIKNFNRSNDFLTKIKTSVIAQIANFESSVRVK